MNKRKLLPNLDRNSQEKEFQALLARSQEDVGLRHKLPRIEHGGLCTHCSNINFVELLSKPTTHKTRPKLEEAFKTKYCTFCQLIWTTVEKAYPNLNIASRLPWSRVFDKGILYKVFSYQPSGWPAWRGLRIAVDVGWKGFSQTKQGRVWAPQPDRNSDTMSFDPYGRTWHLDELTSDFPITRRLIPSSVSLPWLRRMLNSCEECRTHRIKLDETGSALSAGLSALQHSDRFRLIDVHTLQVTSFTGSKMPRYFALSYEWGSKAKEYRCAKTIVSENPRTWSLQLDSFPPVIRDTIHLLHSIGESYLWIDTICIQQTEPEDVSSIVGQMGDIYCHGFATVVAACGGSDVGLTRMHIREFRNEAATTFSSRGLSLSLLPSRAELDALIRRTSWDRRGWTYQERLLSQRCVFFLDDEVFLACSHSIVREAYNFQDNVSIGRAHEAGTDGSVSTKGPTPNVSEALPRVTFTWIHFAESLEAYTRRTLTVKEDRLDAYRGILAQLMPTLKPPAMTLPDIILSNLSALKPSTMPLPDIILSGLPQRWFLQALLWEPYASESTRQAKLPIRILDRDQKPKFPTWSWAAWHCPVRYNTLFCASSKRSQPDLRLIDDHNIVLSPIKTVKYIGPWTQWPPSMIESCSPIDCPLITIHVYVLVMRCCIKDSPDSIGHFGFYAMQGELPHGDDKHIAYAGNMKKYFPALPMRQHYDLAVLPFSASEQKLQDLPAIFIERQDGFVERLPVPLVRVSRERVNQYGRYEYLKLR